jgi:hypothetical protein
MKSNPPAPTSGSRLRAELAHLGLEGVHLLGREDPGEQCSVQIVDRWILHEDDPRRKRDVGLDDLEGRTTARTIRIPVHHRFVDIVEPTQREEVVLLVVIERRLLTETLPDRIRVFVDLGIKRVIVEVGVARCGHIHPPVTAAACDGLDLKISVLATALTSLAVPPPQSALAASPGRRMAINAAA